MSENNKEVNSECNPMPWKEHIGPRPPTYDTLIDLMEEHPNIIGDVRFNEMKDCIEWKGNPLKDENIVQIGLILLEKFSLENKNGDIVCARFGKEAIWDALGEVARRHSYHPVREYLIGLRWDGMERIKFALEDLLGIQDPAGIEQDMFRRWLIGAVARVFQPGCKMDNMLVIIDETQGKGKSTFFQQLAGDVWFTDANIDFANKDAMMVSSGAWIHEIAEFTSIRKTKDLEIVKAHLSSRVDTFRAPYCRTVQSRPRTYIFCGTSNNRGLLQDNENRRFWPLRTGEEIRNDLMPEWRDQLWAEAMQLYKDKERWWFEPEENAKLKEWQSFQSFEESHPWEEEISKVLTSGRYATTEEQIQRVQQDMLELRIVTASAMLEECGVPLGQQDPGKARNVAKILRRIGWVEAGHRRVKEVRLKCWLPKPK